ncbi:hypothetical protein [Nocardia sp. NPDC005978]|uniref:hypothetical protein n=1 Tax=unclassified Nocardia TaxID=2637762 RepID=UPI0033B676F8
MKHRKPNRIKASTSLPLAAAAAVVSLLSAPANAAPADPGAVPAAPVQPGTTDENPAPEVVEVPEQAAVVPGTKPESVPNNNTKPQQSQPGVTKPESPETKKPDAKTEDTQPAAVDPKAVQPKVAQPGVSSPRVAPLPVPGQSVPVQVEVKPDAQPGQSTQPGLTNPGQSTVPGRTTEPETELVIDGTEGSEPETVINTLTGDDAVTPKPQWQAPVVETAPAAPVVEMTGPHTEIGANIDGGATLPGWAANTHHFSNLDGYVGTIGYTTPGGLGEAGVALDFTVGNQVKVTAFATANAGDDRKLEFILDTAAANAVKADTENFIRLLPGGATVLEAASQIGRLPVGDMPGQTTDLGGVTTQVGGSVQY